jgi:PAS domain S-box-containing protein
MIAADEQRLTRSQFEHALADLDDEAYELTLFVSGASDSSSQAVTNVRAICDAHLSGRYHLDIVDLNQEPVLGEQHNVLATPTLVKDRPLPTRMLVGDMSDHPRVLVALDVRATPPRCRFRGRRCARFVVIDHVENPPWEPAHPSTESLPTVIPASVSDVQVQLMEAEETLRAIRNGEVDALVVRDSSPTAQVFTLSSADRPYRMFVEHMRDGAATVSDSGIILYANRRLADMLGAPMQQIIGSPISSHLASSDHEALRTISGQAGVRGGTIEAELVTGDGGTIPVRINASTLDVDGHGLICLTLADLTEQNAHKREIDRLSRAQTDRMR